MFAGRRQIWDMLAGGTCISTSRTLGCREKEGKPGAGSQGLALPTWLHSPPIYEDAKNSTCKPAFQGLVERPR